MFSSLDRIPNKGTVGNLPVLQCCHEVVFPLILLIIRTGLIKRTLVIPHYATEQGAVIILAIRCLKYKETSEFQQLLTYLKTMFHWLKNSAYINHEREFLLKGNDQLLLNPDFLKPKQATSNVEVSGTEDFPSARLPWSKRSLTPSASKFWVGGNQPI